jgi:hypothetical protein
MIFSKDIPRIFVNNDIGLAFHTDRKRLLFRRFKWVLSHVISQKGSSVQTPDDCKKTLQEEDRVHVVPTKTIVVTS